MSAYTALPPVKLTTSTDPATVAAAYQPITGGTLLVDGTQAATEANSVFGTGYTTWGTCCGFPGFGIPNYYVIQPTGVAAFVGNGGGTQAEFSNSTTPFVSTGPGLSIGFPFTFNGESFDRIGISSQGWIGFGKSADGASAVKVYTATGASSNYLPLNNTTIDNAANRNRVVAYGIMGATGAGGNSLMPYVFQSGYSTYPGSALRMETVGTAPNRVCVVQWENYIAYPSGMTSGPNPSLFRFMNFQIRLYETTNRVEVRYGQCQGGSGVSGASQIGLGGKVGGNVASRDFNAWVKDQSIGGGWPQAWNGDFTARQALPDPTGLVQSLPSSVYPSSSSSTSTISSTSQNTPDMLSFVWAPPACPQQASALVISNVTPSEASISWSGTGNFDYAVSTTNSTVGLTPTGNTSGNSASFSGLASGTTHYVFVRTNCGDEQSAWTLTGSFKTLFSATCGDTWTDHAEPGDPYCAGCYYVGQVDETTVICPTTPGDKAKVTFTTFNLYENSAAMFVYDGPNTASTPILSASAGYTNGGYSFPAGGWKSPGIPGPFTSTHAGGCLTFRFRSYNFPAEGWVANVTCAPPVTCFPPATLTAPATTVHTADLAWSGTDAQYQYRVVAGGQPVTGTIVATDVVAANTATVVGLTANTAYSAYVRSICAPEDTSEWRLAPVNFRTKPGCGGAYDLYPSAAYAAYPTPVDSTVVICPDSPGDQVKLTLSQFSFGQGGNGLVGLLVHDGNSTAAPLFDSGLPAKTSGVNTLPAGAYWGNTYQYTTGSPTGTLPGPFTSTASNGCLTLHFIAKSASTYDQGMKANVTCAPAPPCATPGGVAISAITHESAIVSWTGAGTDYIIEYGPVGFTPGTGATAGGGTVVSNAVSGQVLNGLAATTTYDIYVRQVCAGPTYSANSFRVRFRTSMDCSVAQVISCGDLVPNDFVLWEEGNAAYTSGSYTSASACPGTAEATGKERLFRFTASVAGTYQLSVPAVTNANSSYFKTTYLIAPVSAGCAASAFTCVGDAPVAGASLDMTGLAAGDYYIMNDAHSSYEGSQPFNLYCPGLPPCVTAPTNPGNNAVIASNTTPIAFSWPAAFGATGYDIYFNGSLVAPNHPTNSISSSSYTPANIAALYGIGTPVTWRAVPRNSYGTATCPTNWTFSVGGNGTSNAIPLISGVAASGNNRTANGQGNNIAALWGNDVVYSFTASDCATGVNVSMCPTAASGSVYSNLKVMSGNTVIGSPVEGSTMSPNCQQLNVPVQPGQSYYIIVDAYASQFDFNLTYTEVVDPTDTDGDGTPDCSDACPENPDLTEEGVCGCDAVVDTDNDGIADCIDMCPLLAGEVGSPCDPGPGFANGVIDENCACIGEPLDCEGVPNGSALPGTACNDGNASTENDVYGVDCVCAGTPIPPCTGNQAVVVIRTDANGGQTTWQIQDAFAFTVASGGPYTGQDNTVIST
ncbi:MAG: fibronectin type III domain-containing protein, partial [Bacteroidetes bacterium]|nr:fibronectin type III domain-containing protein [Bacteroidota bacterium]